MPTSSDSGDNHVPPVRLFGTEKPLHQALGEGAVADILLWRNRNISAAILLGFTLIWFLFEVLDYNFVTLACHISITLMLILFLWFTGADIIKLNPPDPRAVTIPNSVFHWLSNKTNQTLVKVYKVSSGEDLKTFFMALTLLWILSGIGKCCSFLNLLYICFLGTMILPVVYEQYQNEVDYLASKGDQDLRKLYKKLDSKVLGKIPRGPLKDKKKL